MFSDLVLWYSDLYFIFFYSVTSIGININIRFHIKYKLYFQNIKDSNQLMQLRQYKWLKNICFRILTNVKWLMLLISYQSCSDVTVFHYFKQTVDLASILKQGFQNGPLSILYNDKVSSFYLFYSKFWNFRVSKIRIGCSKDWLKPW